MRLSRKYPVPREFGLLYEFLNSLDLRCFQEHGSPHPTGDEIATPEALAKWLRDRKLLDAGMVITAVEHRRVLDLRGSIRNWLQAVPDERGKAFAAASAVNEAASRFPLVLGISSAGAIELRSADHSAAQGIGSILWEFLRAAATGRLARLKMCASDECRWIFFDRSKPASRRWCSPILCGNREKTRAYRRRRRSR